MLLFWALDRFSREGIRKTIAYLERLDGFDRWAPVLTKMREQRLSQGRMSWEMGLSYNTVKKYLRRLETEA